MKMKKSLIFVKKKIENKCVKDEKYCKVRGKYINIYIQKNIKLLRRAYLISNMMYLKKFI